MTETTLTYDTAVESAYDPTLAEAIVAAIEKAAQATEPFMFGELMDLFPDDMALDPDPAAGEFRSLMISPTSSVCIWPSLSKRMLDTLLKMSADDVISIGPNMLKRYKRLHWMPTHIVLGPAPDGAVLLT